ncbi:MAG: ABC transporter substrate-binding protein [Methanoregula sp.]|jgi:iron complex transport system substrate-binding protein
MEIKNPGIIVLTILIAIVTGIVLFGIHDLTVTGNQSLAGEIITGNGSEFPDIMTTPAVVPVTTQKGGGLLSGPDKVEPDASSRTITDNAGRKVTIPAHPAKVLGSATFVYLVAPEKLGGWESDLTSDSRKFFSALPENLTITGSSSSNYEAYIALHPDLVFISCGDGNAIRYDSVNLTQEKYGSIPVVCLNNTQNVTNSVSSFRFMGDVLGVPVRADELIRYYERVSGEIRVKVSAIPEEKRVRVYYAEGANGLATDASGSIHSQLIDLCGGKNVAGFGGLQSGSGMTAVTMESVLMWNPDAIITTSKEFATNAYNDSSWQRIPAVRNHRVYVTPGKPSNWFDRSPNINRIAGLSWTAHVLYPDLFSEDWLKKNVKEYFSLYYRYDMSDEEITAVLYP